MDLVVQVLECLAHTLSVHHTCLMIKTVLNGCLETLDNITINMTTFVFLKSLVKGFSSP